MSPRRPLWANPSLTPGTTPWPCRLLHSSPAQLARSLRAQAHWSCSLPTIVNAVPTPNGVQTQQQLSTRSGNGRLAQMPARVSALPSLSHTSPVPPSPTLPTPSCSPDATPLHHLFPTTHKSGQRRAGRSPRLQIHFSLKLSSPGSFR